MLCQLCGEVVVYLLGIPVPGAVIGMLLLLVALLLRGGEVPAWLRTPAQGLLSYLSLLFVPAGVGIMQYWQLIQSDLATLIVTLFVSSFISLYITGWVMQKLIRRKERGV